MLLSGWDVSGAGRIKAGKTASAILHEMGLFVKG
jgi:hypothetical protein